MATFLNTTGRKVGAVIFALLSLLTISLIALMTIDLAPIYNRRYDFMSTSLVPSLGAVVVNGHHFVVVVDETELVGRLFGLPVYEVTGVELVHVPTAAGPGAVKTKVDAGTVAEAGLVEEYLERAGFYFAPHPHDLSLNYECVKFDQCTAERRLHFRANQHMLDTLSTLPDPVKSPYVHLPAIRGHVEMGCILASTPGVDSLCGSIVSRTSSKRTSTRFSSRGADQAGNVSNFVETEMAVSHGKAVASFIQIRGSIPLLWGQQASLTKTSPPISLEKDDKVNKEYFGKHVDLLKRLYNSRKTVMVSLVDQERGKNECELGGKFVELSQAFPATPLIAFDYHAEHDASKHGWRDRLLQMVYEKLGGQLTYTLSSPTATSLHQQSIIRTNCVDCLDRTNAVQSTFAKALLPRILQSVLPATATLAPADLAAFTKLMGLYWSHNANAVSLQYAGSPALKTDIAKTGKRTSKGRLHDLKATIKRYFNANWFDQHRKKAMEVVFGPGSVDQEDIADAQ